LEAADPGGRAVRAAIAALPAASQHQVLEALRDVLACLDGASSTRRNGVARNAFLRNVILRNAHLRSSALAW
jgi:hypothetical protein